MQQVCGSGVKDGALNERAGDSVSSADWLYLNVLAPVLVSYVKWVLAEAIRSKKKRLYFLARDGYQMYLVAERLCKAWNLDVECRYLYVSRYAIRVPEYHLIGEKCLERICIGGIDVTFEKIMKRAALSEKEALVVADECGYREKYRTLLHYQEVMQIKSILKNSTHFFEYVYAHSKEAYPKAIGYFKQEGLLDPVPYALVDSGWIGTLQQSLQNLIDSVKKKNSTNLSNRIEGYYFGLYELPTEAEKENYHAFYFRPNGNIRRKVHFSNSLFEAVFSAPDGMTIGYEEQQDGSFRPVFDQKEHPNQEQIRKNVELLNIYLQEYLSQNTGEGLADNYETRRQLWHAGLKKQATEQEIQMVEGLLSKFMGEPTSFELEAYGGILFSDDVLEDDLKKVSADLSEEEIKNQSFWNKTLIMLGIKKAEIHESAWIEGSIVKNGNNIGHNLRQAARYKYFVYLRKWLKKRKY